MVKPRTISFKHGDQDNGPLTRETFDHIVADAMVLLFEYVEERKRGNPKSVKMFGNMDGLLTVYHGTIEVYRGHQREEAIEAYNKARGL